MIRLPHWYVNHPRLPFAERFEVLSLPCRNCGALLPNFDSNRSTCDACHHLDAMRRAPGRRAHLVHSLQGLYDPLTDPTIRDVIIARGLASAWADVCQELEVLFESCLEAYEHATPDARICIEEFVNAYRDSKLQHASGRLVGFSLMRLKGLGIVHGTKSEPRNPATGAHHIRVLDVPLRSDS